MRRIIPVTAVLALITACDSPSEPRSDDDVDAAFAVSDEAIIEVASGSAHRSALGAPVILSFSATKRADGTVKGQYYFRAIGTDPDQWLRVDVTCMTIVDGNKAWIAGITVDAFLPQLIGRVSYFYAFDNGEGETAAPDVVSLVRANDVDGADEEFCTTLPTVLPSVEILHGNINIRG